MSVMVVRSFRTFKEPHVHDTHYYYRPSAGPETGIVVRLRAGGQHEQEESLFVYKPFVRLHACRCSVHLSCSRCSGSA